MMNEEIGKNHLGKTIGTFAALCHLIWVILAGLGIAHTMLRKMLTLHFIKLEFSAIDFSFLRAVLLIIIAYIGGYIVGWVFAAVWNKLGKSKKTMA